MVGRGVAIMADITRGIRSGRDFFQQALFLQLAEMQLMPGLVSAVAFDGF